MKATDVRKALATLSNETKAATSRRFFKTGPGEYSEGDIFIGVTVPEQRKVARAFGALPLGEVDKLLGSKIHEERLTALIMLVDRFSDGDTTERARVVKVYLSNLRHVNNWDLVDSSAHQILGTWLLDKDRASLRKLAKSKELWERRVAMVATYAFINAGEHADAFAIAGMLINDEHDLMHKAVGWMLREVGKRVGEDVLRGFLREYAAALPRTALRYAIERFSPTERAQWLARPSAKTTSGTTRKR